MEAGVTLFSLCRSLLTPLTPSISCFIFDFIVKYGFGVVIYKRLFEIACLLTRKSVHLEKMNQLVF